jgi:hypothetical protein
MVSRASVVGRESLLRDRKKRLRSSDDGAKKRHNMNTLYTHVLRRYIIPKHYSGLKANDIQYQTTAIKT